MKPTTETGRSALKLPPPCLAMRAPRCAAAIDVSPRTLSMWTASGIIPHFRLGGVLLYPVDAVREWLVEQAKEGKQP